jgi:hypothetical protein
MRLREVASPFRYSVFAVCDDSGICQVENVLLSLKNGGYDRAVANIMATMRDWTPQFGPPLDVDERARRLREDICEFRASQKKKKQVLRVFFFMHESEVVCTSAALKRHPTPDERIAEAIVIREQYLRCLPTKDFEYLRGWAL